MNVEYERFEHIVRAKINGVLVGYVEIRMAWQAYGDKTFGSICNLNVSEEYRRQGIATHLLKICENYARQRGVKTIELQVSQDNEPALALYQKFGFDVLKYPDPPDTMYGSHSYTLSKSIL